MPTPEVLSGDCRSVLADLLKEGRQVDAVVTDPPYHLDSIVKRFGKKGAAPAQQGADGRFTRQSDGFIGQKWDGEEGGVKIACDPEVWGRAFRLLRPGGMILAFSSSRTYHHMACAIESVGFATHPMIGWVYGQGFPKGHSTSRDLARSKAPGAAQESDKWVGWHHGAQTLKPSLEPIYVGQKPYSEKTAALNTLKNGVGGYHTEACRGTGGRWPSNLVHDGTPDVVAALGGGEFFNSFPAEIGYHAKATKKDRAGSKHPTVKPIGLLRWMCRLITPPGGVVLDPFAGSGTTGEAARLEGLRSLLIERDPEYLADIRRRFGLPEDFSDLIGDASLSLEMELIG